VSLGGVQRIKCKAFKALEPIREYAAFGIGRGGEGVWMFYCNLLIELSVFRAMAQEESREAAWAALD